MAVYKRGGTWWYEFIFAGKRVRESAKTSRKTIALESERQKGLDPERALAGIAIDPALNRIRSVADAIATYLLHYPADHRKKATVWTNGCLAHVKKHLSGLLLPDVTENRIRQYIVSRRNEGASNRTINMEIRELSRAMLALMGPMSRMLERYSHIRLKAKGVEALKLRTEMVVARVPTKVPTTSASRVLKNAVNSRFYW